MKIGVFDSGLGGLTVLSKLVNKLPGEDFIYFGDNARVPYGNKSERMIKHFSNQAIQFLLSKNVEMIVVACNTASALAIDEIIGEAKVPVIGMINPAVESAIKHSKSKKIGVIGTESTINSNSYQKKFLDRGIEIKTRACPLFVPFVEAGVTDHPALDLMIKEYLEIFEEEDTLVLGCTHYPFLRKSIEKYFPNKAIIDTGEAAASLISKDQQSKSIRKNSNIEYYVSDRPNSFINIAENKLGLRIKDLEQIDIENW